MSRPRFIGFIIAVLGLALAGSLALAAKGPKIVFEKKELVFRDIKEGQPLTADFTFSNQGDQNLLIEKVSPSCGCTVAEFDKIIPPGSKGVIHLKLDTQGINGSFRKSAVVVSNDTSHNYVTLVMMGETKSRIKVDKGRRIELIGCLGRDISTSAVLTDPDGEKLLIGGVENPMKEYLKATVETVVPGRKYRLVLKAIAKEAMRFAGPLFLRVPGAPRVSLYVVVDVRGPFVVQPLNLYFGGLKKGGKTFARNILVRRACAKKLVIDGLRYNKDMFSVKQIWEKPGQRLVLEVTPRLDKMPLGGFDEKISIQSGDKAFSVRLKGAVH